MTILTLLIYVCDRCASSVIQQRFNDSIPQPYNELLTMFEKYEYENIQTFILEKEELFQADHNFGLVKQIIHALYQKRLIDISKSFNHISMNDIGEMLRLPMSQRNKYICEMIEQLNRTSRISAIVNEQLKTVQFREPLCMKYEADSVAQLNHVTEQLQTVMKVSEMIRQLHTSALQSPQFVYAAANNPTV